MLKGERVRLRPVKRSDTEFFVKWLNDPQVTQYIDRDFPLTGMEEEQWIEELAEKKNRVVLVIEIREEGLYKPIGNCGLHKINLVNRTATFGIIIGEKNCWEKGYGTEASELLIDYGFNRLNLRRISSSVLEFNKRSIGLHKKLGFKKEGRRRKARFKNGQFWDLLEFGLLRKEWEK